MKNWKEVLIEAVAFIGAIVTLSTGIGLIVYYLLTGITPLTFLAGLGGFYILYPAFKAWQERIKDLF